MKKAIDILSITSDKLKKGKYKSILPEFYALRTVTENNSWHLNQNVFDHVVAVFAGLEIVQKLDFLQGKYRKKIKKYLDKKAGKFTRRELLIVAALLHDIAKTDVLIEDSSGKTKSPGHEIISSVMIGKFASRFGLDGKGKEYVERMVHYHGFTNDILSIALYKNNEAKYLRLFKEAVGDIHLELLLLMYADILGSDLKKSDPEEFGVRLNLIKSFLETN